MIDTVKIYTMIDKFIYDIICCNSVVKTSYHSATGEIYYNIINDHLQGSYDSSLSIRVDTGSKYGFINSYVLEIEGSYHKILKGYNSHDGFYNLSDIVLGLKNIVENAYSIKLPDLKHWFVNRIDIAICFDLVEQKNVLGYINNLSACKYPRRELRNFGDYGGTGVYYSGTSTTLKIYNKYVEFKKHDFNKFKNTSFDLLKYLDFIKGFVRFEVEIKKKKLVSIYNKKYIRVRNVNYSDLKNVWSNEFMKLLKMYESELKLVRSKEEVEKRLITLYGNSKGSRLYNFYLSLIIDGSELVKSRTSHNWYYTNTRDLKKAGVDFSQMLDIDFDNILDFNPFEWKEVV